MTQDGPPRPEALLVAQDEALDRACDRFEAAWRAGERPRIEEYLGGTEGAERAVRARELIAIDLHWRARAGERATAGEYLERLPGNAEAVHAAFERIDRFGSGRWRADGAGAGAEIVPTPF